MSAQQPQRRLIHQHLLKRQPPPRQPQVFYIQREMRLPDGEIQLTQLMADAQVVRPRLRAAIIDLFQRLLHHFAEGLRRNPLHSAVHRQDTRLRHPLRILEHGFSPALPKIPAELMGQIIAFFRALMTDHGENEAFAQIYWDKAEKRFFAYVPKQSVCKEEVEADLHDCPYDDEERYLCYADIHSHNSMDAFFSGKDDQDERSTGLYLVLGKLDKFYPDVKARIFCGDSFVSIDPNIVMEGLEQPFPKEWLTQVSIRSRKSEQFKKPDKRSFRDLLEEAFL